MSVLISSTALESNVLAPASSFRFVWIDPVKRASIRPVRISSRTAAHRPPNRPRVVGSAEQRPLAHARVAPRRQLALYLRLNLAFCMESKATLSS
eukprot:6173258-Pleurochrysis_carterae.AAC.2